MKPRIDLTGRFFTVLGAGSWGSALALQLAYAGNEVTLWAHRGEHAAAMKSDKSNERYLPGVSFPPTLTVCDDLHEAVQASQHLLIAVPSHAYADLIDQVKPLYAGQGIISATKGFTKEGRLFSDIVRERLATAPFAVLSGPSFAGEVATQLPTTIVLASSEASYVNQIAQHISHGTFRAYTSDDVIGVQVGGAVKNVLAVAVGISDGLGFGANARAALMTRGMAELIRLGVALGADPQTMIGLSGLGDLVLTCTDDQSRNRRFGLAIGKAHSVARALEGIGQVVESVATVKHVYQLAQTQHIDMPITEQVHLLLQNKLTLDQAVDRLFARELKAE
jgi:glycerol-3-phosphate dehydrogenase (NAD(P)+)